jgi:hypothetical protein
MRLPVALKIAFVTAGATVPTAASPMPPHMSPPASEKCVSNVGVSEMRNMR